MMNTHVSRRSAIATVVGTALAAAASAGTLKPRLRPALCAYSFRNELEKGTLKYEDLIRISAENDLDGVDLTVYWFPNTEDSFLLPLKRTAFKAGIEIYSISVRTVLTQPAGATRVKAAEDLKKWIDAWAVGDAGGWQSVR